MNKQLNRILRRIGVSRINEISNFDDLPIHVYQTIRPNALHIKVDSGNGRTKYESYISAAIESIERFTAENIRNPIYTVLPNSIAPDICGRYSIQNKINTGIPVVMGINLINGKDVYIPLDMCSYFVFNPSRTIPHFSNGSTGLGAHYSIEQAVLSGMLEILEREAIANNKTIKFDLPLSARINEILYSILDKIPSLQITQYQCRAGLVVVHIKSSDKNVNGGFNAFGTGLDLEMALEDALSEAMQTWILRISASRDDWSYCISPYRDNRDATLTITMEAMNSLSTKKLSSANILDFNKYSIDSYKFLIDYFRRCKVNVYAVDLQTYINIRPIYVAKVVIPSATPLRHGPMLTGFPVLSI